MPFEVNGQTMYSTKEACSLAGTNVNTFFRWVRQGKFADVEYRDRNNWRLFTADDVSRLEARVKSISRVSVGT
jgi:predicted site-specific integrase-resolvase